MSAHTQEPWVLAFGGPSKDWPQAETASGVIVARAYAPNAEANAARLVACVNACEGMANPEDVVRAMWASLEQAAALRTQRDELLAALQSMCDQHGPNNAAMSALMKYGEWEKYCIHDAKAGTP